jgi:hypothetical protein
MKRENKIDAYEELLKWWRDWALDEAIQWKSNVYNRQVLQCPICKAEHWTNRTKIEHHKTCLIAVTERYLDD